MTTTSTTPIDAREDCAERVRDLADAFSRWSKRADEVSLECTTERGHASWKAESRTWQHARTAMLRAVFGDDAVFGEDAE